MLSTLSRLAGFLSRANARLSILIYHQVLSEPDPLKPGDPDRAEFERQMALVARCFTPLPLAEAVARLRDGTLPPRALCVTFDDGYADNLVNAKPILEKYGVPATVFIATDFIDGGRMWNDTVLESVRLYDGERLDLGECGLGSYVTDSWQGKASSVSALLKDIKHLPPAQRDAVVAAVAERVAGTLPNDLMLTHAQLIELGEGIIDIGAHTLSHPILASLEPQQAREEIEGSKRLLEDWLGRPVELFAYPNGVPEQDFSALHRDLVREAGFAAAVSTRPGVSHTGSNPYQLSRFTPWDRSNVRYLLRLHMNARSVAE